MLNVQCSIINVKIGEQSVETAFAADAAFFVSAKGGGGVELVVGVCPDDSGFDLGCDAEEF